MISLSWCNVRVGELSASRAAVHLVDAFVRPPISLAWRMLYVVVSGEGSGGHTKPLGRRRLLSRYNSSVAVCALSLIPEHLVHKYQCTVQANFLRVWVFRQTRRMRSTTTLAHKKCCPKINAVSWQSSGIVIHSKRMNASSAFLTRWGNKPTYIHQ